MNTYVYCLPLPAYWYCTFLFLFDGSFIVKQANVDHCLVLWMRTTIVKECRIIAFTMRRWVFTFHLKDPKPKKWARFYTMWFQDAPVVVSKPAPLTRTSRAATRVRLAGWSPCCGRLDRTLRLNLSKYRALPTAAPVSGLLLYFISPLGTQLKTLLAVDIFNY